MSFRQDYYGMLEGKTPESDVLSYSFATAPGVESGLVTVAPQFLSFGREVDNWGVEYVWDINKTGMIPKPGNFILKDITKWRDVIKAPDISGYDWDAISRSDLANVKVDRETQVLSMMVGVGGYFLQLAGFMGFEGALLAMAEEPESVKELFDYISAYDCELMGKSCEYYKPDVLGIGDDTATEINPFMSVGMFRELLLPYYKRLADIVRGNGLVFNYHNCGRCEDFMDDMIGIGVQVWNCATPVNDLVAFKEKTGNKVICEVMPRLYLTGTEEDTRQKVRETIDTYAPGGAFIWIGNASATGPIAERIDLWAQDEVKNYGKGFYKRQSSLA